MDIAWEECKRKGLMCYHCKNDIIKGEPMIAIRYRGYRQSASKYFCEPHLNEYIQTLKLKKIVGE